MAGGNFFLHTGMGKSSGRKRSCAVSQRPVDFVERIRKSLEAVFEIAADGLRHQSVSSKITRMQFFDVSNHGGDKRRSLTRRAALAMLESQLGFHRANHGTKGSDLAFHLFCHSLRKRIARGEFGFQGFEEFQKLEGVFLKKAHANR